MESAWYVIFDVKKEKLHFLHFFGFRGGGGGAQSLRWVRNQNGLFCHV